jgi:hypothetical protein
VKVVLVTHFERGQVSAAAERVESIERALGALGHSVDRVVLAPDARLRRRRAAHWWYHSASDTFLAGLSRRLAGADLLIASYLPVAAAVAPAAAAAGSGCVTVHDAHNDELRLARQYMRPRAVRGIAAMEAGVIEAYDLTWAPGSVDIGTLQERYPHARFVDLLTAAPLMPDAPPPPDATGAAFTYGTWDYEPNVHGLARLAATEFAGEGTLRVFGRMPDRLRTELVRSAKRAQPRVKWRFEGFEPDFVRLVATGAGPAVIPLWQGAGTKVRVVQMAAMGVPLCATPEAVSGLPPWLGDAVRPEPDPQRLLTRALCTDGDAWSAAAELSRRVREDLAWPPLLERALAESL